MLHSILKRKLPITKPNEDSLTSSIIGIMQYLPGEIFWSLIRKACTDSTNLPEIAGHLIEICFWPKWSAEGIKDRTYIEPDVFIRFSNFDLIIEAKRTDEAGQYKEQWENQIRAYYNEYEDHKTLYYITLGGNSNKQNTPLPVKNLQDKAVVNFEIYKCNWFGLLIQVEELKNQLSKINSSHPISREKIRLLDDIIQGFNYHGFFNIDWFDGMKYQSIRKQSLQTLSQLEIY